MTGPIGRLVEAVEPFAPKEVSDGLRTVARGWRELHEDYLAWLDKRSRGKPVIQATESENHPSHDINPHNGQ